MAKSMANACPHQPTRRCVLCRAREGVGFEEEESNNNQPETLDSKLLLAKSYHLFVELLFFQFAIGLFGLQNARQRNRRHDDYYLYCL